MLLWEQNRCWVMFRKSRIECSISQTLNPRAEPLPNFKQCLASDMFFARIFPRKDPFGSRKNKKPVSVSHGPYIPRAIYTLFDGLEIRDTPLNFGFLSLLYVTSSSMNFLAFFPRFVTDFKYPSPTKIFAMESLSFE